MDINKKILDLQDVQSLTPLLEKLTIIDRDVANDAQVIVFDVHKKTLSLLTTNNFPLKLKKVTDDLLQKGYKFILYYTGLEGFHHALTRYDKLEQKHENQRLLDSKKAHVSGSDALSMIQELYEHKSEYTANDFVMELVRLAFQAGASDLHFQSEKKGVFMKVRIDGVLHSVLEFTHQEYRQYLAKIKFLSGIKMNISKIPQDGRFSFDTSVHHQSDNVDVRVNTLPGLYQDGVVMRYLESSQSLDSFPYLGFTEHHIELLNKYLDRKHGMIFVTGPTGSGKTTTLYTMLDSINSGEIKIITLEDPVEYQLEGIEQSQINEKDGYTYELGLRAILRHDPDVILVGETRDLETADTIVNAALTGHLVFTTIHTNSALETISRLISMGVKTYLLAPAIQLICAQRLVRKLCPHCMRMESATDAEKKEVYLYLGQMKNKIKWNEKLPRAVGCDHCNHLGYKGRMGVFELLTVHDTLRNMIIDQVPYDDMQEYLRNEGFQTMFHDGVMKVLEGKTTMEELRKIV